jgi:hypothetical protein
MNKFTMNEPVMVMATIRQIKSIQGEIFYQIASKSGHGLLWVTEKDLRPKPVKRKSK